MICDIVQENLKKLDDWLKQNKHQFKGRIREYKRLMENFCISCEKPDYGDYLNFRSDIRDCKPEHWAILLNGFFSMYNVSLTTLEMHSISENDPRRN